MAVPVANMLHQILRSLPDVSFRTPRHALLRVSVCFQHFENAIGSIDSVHFLFEAFAVDPGEVRVDGIKEVSSFAHNITEYVLLLRMQTEQLVVPSVFDRCLLLRFFHEKRVIQKLLQQILIPPDVVDVWRVLLLPVIE